MKKRNIPLCIILIFLTCGIYSLFWFCSLTNDMNEIAPTDYQTPGGTALLLTLVTCGIYGIFWSYKMGEKMDELKGGNNAVLFLVFSLIGLGIINYIMMQDQINQKCVA